MSHRRVWNSIVRRKKKKHLDSSGTDDESQESVCEFMNAKEPQRSLGKMLNYINCYKKDIFGDIACKLQIFPFIIFCLFQACVLPFIFLPTLLMRNKFI